MTSFAALSAAALLAGLTASPLGVRPTPTGDVTFEAGQTVWNAEAGTYDLSGGVVVRRGAVLLRARRALLDPAHDEVQATGDVLLVDAARVLHADGIHAVIDGPFEASGVIAFLKDKPLELARATSLEEARRGRNRVTFSANQVDGDAEGRLTLHGARFTLCDCGEGKAPTWELRSGRARVADDRAALTWPTLYVTPRFLLVQHPVPVLILPWISLPLLERQSGLLFTEFGTAPATGWYLAQPVYLTLGRSADLTATPEYFFGPGNPDQAGGSVKGPGARVELRWAPAERAEGVVRWHVVEDQDHERPGWAGYPGRPGGPIAPGAAAAGGAGTRLSLEGSHRQDLGPGTRLVGHLSLSQDPFMFRDFQGTGLPSDAYYARSDALASRRAADFVLEAGAAYYEPLVSTIQTWRPATFGWFGAQAPALQRWPSLGAVLLPVGLGPLELQGRAGISRFAPLVGHVGELLPTDPGYYRTDTAHLDDRTIRLPREAVTRSEGRLELSAPLLLWRAISFEPFVRGAVLGYAFDADRPAAATAWGVAGVSTSAVLARRFGEAEHRIVPRLELLAGTAPWRANPGDPFPAYDLWDRIESGRQVMIPGATPGTPQPTTVVQKLSAAPDGAYAQLRGSVESHLSAGKAGQLDAEVGQDVDVRDGRLAESFASLSGTRGWFAADASARALLFGGRPPRTAGWRASWLDAFTQLHAGASAHDPRGDLVRASLDSTGSGAVGAQGAGVDALFDLGSSGQPPGARATLGAHGALGGASLDYTLQLAARDTLNVQCHDKTVTRAAGQPIQQTAVLAWDSPCHCFVARVRATLDACGAPHVGFDIDLSKILQGASGGGG